MSTEPGQDHGLLYRMKRPRHGSLWLSLTPEELLAKLATLVPPPRVHGLRYHGVYAPHAELRSRVLPDPVEEPAVARKILDHLGLDSTGPPTAHRRPEHADQAEHGAAFGKARPASTMVEVSRLIAPDLLVGSPPSP